MRAVSVTFLLLWELQRSKCPKYGRRARRTLYYKIKLYTYVWFYVFYVLIFKNSGFEVFIFKNSEVFMNGIFGAMYSMRKLRCAGVNKRNTNALCYFLHLRRIKE